MLIVIYCLDRNTSATEYQEVQNLISHFDTGVKRADQHSEECVHTPSRQADILSMRGDTNQQEEMMRTGEEQAATVAAAAVAAAEAPDCPCRKDTRPPHTLSSASSTEPLKGQAFRELLEQYPF